MIRRLRIKFIIIFMSIVSLSLATVVYFVFITTKQHIERTTEDLLMNVMLLDNSHWAINQLTNERAIINPRDIHTDVRMPIMIMQVVNAQNYTVLLNQTYYTDSEDIANIVGKALSAHENYDIISEYSLRYLRMETPEGLNIAFVDASMERHILFGLMRNLIIIISVVLPVFFIISIYLSKWVSNPIERSLDRQNRFLADASHELKTPLTVILSNAGMLTRNGFVTENSKILGWVNNIEVEAKRIKLLVEDMLILARSDSKQIHADFETIDLSYIVLNAALKFEAIIFDNEKNLAFDVPEDIYVTGDSQKIQQLIEILIDNAIKYSYEKSQIQIKLEWADKKQCLLSVNNKGPVIPKDEINNIFVRFYRMDHARRNHGGFGLGLAIAQSIVKEHKCKLWAESTEGSGTTFFVLFNSLCL